MPNQFLLTKEQINRLFPFYIYIDANQKIISYGEHLSKIITLPIGSSLTDVFGVKPEGLLQTPFQELNGRNYQLVMEPKIADESPFILQGDMLYLEDNGGIVFLSTPTFNAYKTDSSGEAVLPTSSARSALHTVRDATSDDDKNANDRPKKDERIATNNIKGMAITDAAGAIEWVSKDFEISTGYHLKEILGKRPRDVVYGQASTHIPSSYVDDMVKKKKAFSFDNIGYNRRGNMYWFRTTVQPIIDEKGNITGRYYTFEDITEYKMNEDAYRHSIDMWKFAINSSGDEVWAFDVENNSMKTSLKFREMIGMEDEDEISFSDLAHKMHPDDYQRYSKEVIPALTVADPSFSFDCRLQNKESRYRYYKIRGKVMEFDDLGTPILYFGTLADINKEKEKDIELQKAASRMEALLKTINYGIILENENRELALISNGVYDIFPIPYPAEQLIGYDCSNLANDLAHLFTPETRFAARIEEVLADRKAVFDEIMYMADGRILERDYIPIYVNNEYYGHLWKYKDITDRKTLEQQLRTSEARLTSLMNNFNQAIMFEDRDQTVLFVNETFRGILTNGGLNGDIVGKKSMPLLDEFKNFFEQPEAEVERVKELVRIKKPSNHDLLKDKLGRTYKRQFIPVIAGNEESGFLWVYDDITESIEASRKLLEQKEYYQRILDELPADIVILTPDFRYKFVNKAAVKNKDVREWVIGKTMYDYFNFRNVDPEFAAARERACNEVLATKTSISSIDVYNNPNGSQKYMLRVIGPLLNDQGEIDEIISYGIDISEQVKNEKKAELQEKRVRDLLNFTNDGIFVCDGNLKITFFNPSFARILDVQDDPSNPSLNLKDLFGENEKQIIHRLLNSLTETDDIQAGNVSVNRTGAKKYLEISFMKALESEANLYIGQITDVTERVNKEKNLNQMIEKERELNNSKSQFIRITSHELRTPLAIIQANVEILQLAKTLPPEKAVQIKDDEMLSRMSKEVTHMTETLNQLLMISRIENGKIEYAPQMVNLNFYLNEINKELYSPHSDGRRLGISLPAETIKQRIDPKLMRHAIVNLVNNAFKYSTGKEPPTLILSETETETRIDIEDHGIGIPEEDKEKLFTTFFRASNTGVIHGSGIGLTIVEYVVNMHGGKIAFTSEQGKGSVFSIILTKQQEPNNEENTGDRR
jgi:PAS domain S-box-containing protein